MKQKINLRLILVAILAVILTMVSIIMVCYSLFQKQVKNDLRITAGALAITGVSDFTKDEAAYDEKNLRITWIGIDGEVLYDNDVQANQMGNHLDRPEVKSAFLDGFGESIRESDTMNMKTFYYALLLSDGTVLRVSTEARSLVSVFMQIFPIILILILIIIVLCVFVSHLLTKQLMTPIYDIAANIDDIPSESVYKELTPFVERIREQHEDILAAAKNRQDFTANVSHELKTPLTAISGYAELLEGNMVSEDKKNHFYHEIRRNSDRLLALINDIIRLSEFDRKTGDETVEEFNLYELAQSTMDVLSVNAEQRGVEITLEGESCNLIGSKDMIKELIENLAQNAIRYNNEGGKVLIRVQGTDNKAVLIVKDNGIGIPAAEQQRVFERFYRVDKSHSREIGGTGLGLAITRSAILMHRGAIKVDSTEGEGTTFTIKVPRTYLA